MTLEAVDFLCYRSVKGVFFRNRVVNPISNPQTRRTSWFEIGVFVLLDGLSSKANELHLQVVQSFS